MLGIDFGFSDLVQLTFACSKLTMETLEKCVECLQVLVANQPLILSLSYMVSDFSFRALVSADYLKINIIVPKQLIWYIWHSL